MEKENDWKEFKIHRVGLSKRTGDYYPPEVIQEALSLIRQRKGPMQGEVSNPICDPEMPKDKYVRRIGSIVQDRVSHQIDLASMRIEGDFVVANIRPCGPMAHEFVKLMEEDRASFAMRSFVEYRGYSANNPSPAIHRTVARCTIVTFDLTHTPL